MRFLVVVLVACGSLQHPQRPTVGSIAGLARDHDSGDPIAKAEIRVRAVGEMAPHATVSGYDGHYSVDRLQPGRYSLSASFAGQPIEVDQIDVRAGDPTIVDLTFTLGRPDPVAIDYFGNYKDGAIDRYHPKGLSPQVAVIEGTVNDSGSRARVAGTVVTAARGDYAQQTVSDDQGRYRLEVAPGTYTVSAYYTVTGHAEIEVRRSDIEVAGAEAVRVPLWLELTRP